MKFRSTPFPKMLWYCDRLIVKHPYHDLGAPGLEFETGDVSYSNRHDTSLFGVRSATLGAPGLEFETGDVSYSNRHDTSLFGVRRAERSEMTAFDETLIFSL